jgi:hypothetical protein
VTLTVVPLKVLCRMAVIWRSESHADLWLVHHEKVKWWGYGICDTPGQETACFVPFLVSPDVPTPAPFVIRISDGKVIG